MQADSPPAPPRPTDRLFFALLPDPATAERIAALAARLRAAHALKGKPLASWRFHVTVQFLGDHAGVPDALVAAASTAASGLRLAPFPIAFDQAASFAGRPRRRPLVMRGAGADVAGVVALHEALGAALQRAGVAVEARYTPHLTLLYDGRLLPPQPVERIAWTARELLLMRSHIGQARHEVLARFALAA